MNEQNARPQYVPGSCNIGEKEIRRRYRNGFIGLFFAILTVALVHFLNANQYWRLIIFIPVFYGLSGFIQAMTKFCFVFGFLSVFSLEGRRMITKVQDDEAKKKDRKKAYLILGIVTLGSILITLIYYLG